MPIEITKTPDGTVAIANCYGNLTESDVAHSVRFAFGSRRIEPGIDRIITIDQDADLHELDIGALQSIQRRILDQELRERGEVSFRSVLVHSSPMQRHLLRLYKAIWDALALPGVEFFVVASEVEAWTILGLVPPILQRDSD